MEVGALVAIAVLANVFRSRRSRTRERTTLSATCLAIAAAQVRKEHAPANSPRVSACTICFVKNLDDLPVP